MPDRKKSPRAKPKAKGAGRAKRAARPKTKPAARPAVASGRGGEGIVYSDVRREAAMRRFLRQSG
jgi:hypothetical protein